MYPQPDNNRFGYIIRNISEKRFIDMEQSPLSMFLLLSTWFVFSYTANEYLFITFVL